jgi:hypothetical protein
MGEKEWGMGEKEGGGNPEDRAAARRYKDAI